MDATSRLYSIGVGYQVKPTWLVSAAGYAYRRAGDAGSRIDVATLAADHAINGWVTAYAIASQVRNGSTASQSAGYYNRPQAPPCCGQSSPIGATSG